LFTKERFNQSAGLCINAAKLCLRTNSHANSCANLPEYIRQKNNNGAFYKSVYKYLLYHSLRYLQEPFLKKLTKELTISAGYIIL